MATNLDQPTATDPKAGQPAPSGVKEPPAAATTELSDDRQEIPEDQAAILAEGAPEDLDEEQGGEGEGEEDPPAPAAAAEPVEVEYEGKKYTLAPELKDALMRTQDYTAKTTEVADSRKTLEADQASFSAHLERTEALHMEYGQLQALDIQIAKYDNVNWTQAMADDPDQANQAWMQFQQMERARGKIQQDIQTKENDVALEKQRTRAKQLEQGRIVLQRDMPEYSPQYAQELGEFAQKQGYSAEELSEVNHDPRYVKILHLAKIGAASLEKKAAIIDPKPSPDPVTPAAVVPSAGRPGAGARNPDRLSTKAWMDRRNKELAAKR